MELIQGGMVSTSQRIMKCCVDGAVFADEADPAFGMLMDYKGFRKVLLQKRKFYVS